MRSMLGLFVLGLVGLVAAGQLRAAAVSVITVTAGKPTEFAFTLSKSSGVAFTVSFKVTNKGKLSHEFKVCATPVKTASLNTCRGTGTKPLKPGESATLPITFGQRGTFEYLSTLPGQAADGMRGLIGVGVSFATTTTEPTASTPTTSTPVALANPAVAAGAALWASGGCGDCHSVSESHVQSGGNITLSLNETHSGGPFRNGPYTATQMQQLAAFINN